MEWVDRLLSPFEWMRAALPNWGDPVATLFVAFGVYAMLFFIAALIAHVSLRGGARATRWYAQQLARGATLEDVVRLEASSARIEAVLLWLATRMVRTSYGPAERVTRLPQRAGERAALRGGRWILRSLWLMLRWIGMFVAALPGFFLTAFGLAVLIASIMTSFPDAIRSAADAMAAFFATASWSEASAVTAATLIAAAVPILIVIAKMLISEPGAARRAFRRRRDEGALTYLHDATRSIGALAEVLREQMHEMVRTFEIEKYHAEQWHEWATRTEPRPYRSWGVGDDHCECDRECLDDVRTGVLPRVHTDRVAGTVADVEAAWGNGLGDQKSALARLVSRRAWSGLVSLWFCMSTSGEFRMHKVPSSDEWRRRRIAWQHQQLVWSGPSEADVAAGRSVAVGVGRHPEEGWLERQLHDLVWELAELSREFSDVADFAHGLTRPRRFERLTRVSAG